MAPSNSQKFSWVKGKAIGSGSFGTVHLATDKATGTVFAVKSAHAESETAFESLKNEADILGTLSSPHVVRCHGTEQVNEEGVVMLMEYAEGGTLSDAVGGALDEQAIRYYTREILHGLAYLHMNGIVHCDLKCKNVLLGSNCSVKLADFGCARRLSKKRNTSKIGGSPLWMAPEVLVRNEERVVLDPKSDIWSLGCTVIEMATGRPPWFGQVSSREAAILKIAGTNHIPPFPEKGLSKEGIDFLKKCLERDPKRRWSAEELLLHHPFVSSIPRQQQLEYAYNPVDSPVSVLTFGCYHDSVDNNNTESEESTTEDALELVKKRMAKYWQLQGGGGSEFFGSSSGRCWITVRC